MMHPDFIVLDAHQHVEDSRSVAWTDTGEQSTPPDPNRQRDELRHRLRYMDSEGIAQAVVIPSPRYLRPGGVADMMRVNDAVLAYRDAAPDRFAAALAVIEPQFGPAAFDEIERVKQLGFGGVCFHTRFQGVAIDDIWVHRIVERMCGVGLAPFIHVMQESVDESHWKLVQLARDFPTVTFVALDGFIGHDGPRQALATAELAPNIIYDTALASRWEVVEEFIRRHGAERVVFGSDAYSFRTTPNSLARILDIDITDEDKAKILGDNIRKVLGLPLSPLRNSD